ESVPMVQKELIKKCNLIGKPVITATQMLDSMQHNPRCTRAEASDVANAIYDGTDAVMLSGETAAGDYPLESVQTMASIALSAEDAQDYKKLLSERTKSLQTNMVTAIGVSVAHTALNLQCKAIVAATESGHTARMISKYRPHAEIVAVTPHDQVARQLQLVWGVHPVLKEGRRDTDALLNTSVTAALEEGFATYGDLLIITAGVPAGEAGTTNLMKLHIVGDVLIRAQGIGRRSTVAEAGVLGSASEVKEKGIEDKSVVKENVRRHHLGCEGCIRAQGIGLRSSVAEAVVLGSASEIKEKDIEDKIVVTQSVEPEMTEHLEKAAGIVTVEGGLTSHGAIVGLNLDLPTIVGASDAFEVLEDGMVITLDAEQNCIFSGHANVL